MFNAVVMAGGKSRLANGKSKAALEFNGKRCIDVVVDALDKSRNINEIIIVGNRDDLGERVNGYNVTQEAGTFFKNVVERGYEYFRVRNYKGLLFYIHSDLPFVTADSIDGFLDNCEDVDFNWPLIDMDKIKEKFPGYKDYYPHPRFNGFAFRNGNCALIRIDRILNCKYKDKYKVFKRAYSTRRFDQMRSIIRCVYTAGPIFLYHLLSKNLDKADFYRGLFNKKEVCFNNGIELIEKIILKRTNVNLKLIKCHSPELAVDVDTLKDKGYIKRYMENL